MSLSLTIRRLSLATRFAASHPWRVLSTPLPALLANAKLGRWRRQGFKVLVFYIDHEEYLPFVMPIWDQLPAAWASEVKICVVSRPHAIAGLKRRLADHRLPPALFLDAWAGGLLTEYDLFLTTHQGSIVPVFGRRPRVCIFHGLPAKGGTFVESQWRFLDGAFLIGPLQRRLFDDLQQSSPPARRIWTRNIGYPKSDAIVNRQYCATNTLESLKLDPARPTVLYAPSWEEHTSLRDAGTQIVAALAELPVNVIVKLHPMSYYPVHEQMATGGVDWKAAFAPWEQRPNVRHVKGGDVAPFVACADVLVTDVSSVAFESILLDRPVVFYDTPAFFNEVAPRMYGIEPATARDDLRYNCGREAGDVARDCDELRDAVLAAISNPSAGAERRERVRNGLLYNPGTSSAAAADAIASLLGLSGALHGNDQ